MEELLHDRYHLMRELGRGSQGVTHMAGDIQTEALVAIKELRWGEVEDWKGHELFEREVAVLRRLDHAGIPKFVDAFETDDAFYLVQEFIEGKNLKQLLDDGQVWSAGALGRLLVDVLDVLEYLHGFSPPILHRDIKPSNIILRPSASYQKGQESQEEQGHSRFTLVDFGAVQIRSNSAVGGSTVIGTPGYMPMEQLQGRAVPATDLYALAATIVHLATRTDPTLLDVQRGKMQFEDRVELPAGFVSALQACLEPHVEDRASSVADVRNFMAGKSEAMAISTMARQLGAEPEDEPSDDYQIAVNAPTALARYLEPDAVLVRGASHSHLEAWCNTVGGDPRRIHMDGVPSFTQVPSHFASDLQQNGFKPIATLVIDGNPPFHHKFIDVSGVVELTFEGEHYTMRSYLEDHTIVGCTNRYGVYQRTEDLEMHIGRNAIGLDYRDQLGRIERSGLKPLRVDSPRQTAMTLAIVNAPLAHRQHKVQVVLIAVAFLIVFLIGFLAFSLLLI